MGIPHIKLRVDENLILYMFTSGKGINKFEIFAGVLLLYTSCISIETDLK